VAKKAAVEAKQTAEKVAKDAVTQLKQEVSKPLSDDTKKKIAGAVSDAKAAASKGESLGQKIGNFFKSAAKSVGKWALDSALPAALTALTELCDELFDKDTVIAYARAQAMLGSVVGFEASVPGSVSYAAVLQFLLTRQGLGEKQIDGSQLLQSSQNMSYSINDTVLLNDGGGANDLEQEKIDFLITTAFVVGLRQPALVPLEELKGNMNMPSLGVGGYTIAAGWVGYEPLVNGGDPGNLLRLISQNSTQFDMKAILAYLQIAGTEPHAFSMSRFLAVAKAYVHADFPVPNNVHSKITSNLIARPEDATEARWPPPANMNPEIQSQYWPLSLAVQNPPALDAYVMGANTYWDVVLGQQPFVMPAGFEKDGWGQDTAVVPIKREMLENCSFLQLYTLAFLEFPRRFRCVDGRPGVVGSGGTVTDGDVDGTQIYSLMNLCKIEGPRVNVLYVVLDVNTRSTGVPLPLSYVDAAGNVTAVNWIDASVNPLPAAVDITDILDDNRTEFATQYNGVYRLWHDLWANPWDERISNTILAETSARHFMGPNVSVDDQGAYDVAGFYYTPGPNLDNRETGYGGPGAPAGLQGTKVGTQGNTGVYQEYTDIVSSAFKFSVSPMYQKGVSTAILSQGGATNNTHTIPQSENTMYMAAAMKFIVPMADPYTGATQVPSHSMASRLTYNLHLASEGLGTMASAYLEKKGLNLAMIHPNTGDPMSYSNSIALHKMRQHLLQHSTYVSIGLNTPSNDDTDAEWDDWLPEASMGGVVSALNYAPASYDDIYSFFVNMGMIELGDQRVHMDASRNWKIMGTRSLVNNIRISTPVHGLAPEDAGSQAVRENYRVLQGQTDQSLSQGGVDPVQSQQWVVYIGVTPGEEWVPYPNFTHTYVESLEVWLTPSLQTTYVTGNAKPTPSIQSKFLLPPTLSAAGIADGGLRRNAPTAMVLSANNQTIAWHHRLVEHTLLPISGSVGHITTGPDIAGSNVDINALLGMQVN
jgi:hypothetical protein